MRDFRTALRALRAVAAASQGDSGLRDVLSRICREIALAFDFERVVISRVEQSPDGSVSVPLAAHGVEASGSPPRTLIAESPLLSGAAARGELFYVADARTEPSLPRDLVERFGMTSLFAVPLLSQGECIGFLAGDRGGESFALDDAECDVLNTAGAFAAAILEKELLRGDLRRLDAAKTQFLALASHELRTPIQTVYGVLATLHHRGGQLLESQRVELRRAAFEQADRVRRLTDQLLDLSRLDAAALALRPEVTVVRRKLEEIVLLVAENRASAVELAVPADLEVAIDPVVLDRIATNLLVNAFRYGAEPIRVEAERRDRHFRMRIEDSGRGVPLEFVDSLFERFTRSEQSQAETGGSGLGLSIAQAYARAHGGEIVYRDADPHGACFEVVIPVPD